jgi:hypothetical protein
MLASPRLSLTLFHSAFLVNEVNKFFHLFPECPDIDPYVGFFTPVLHPVVLRLPGQVDQ